MNNLKGTRRIFLLLIIGMFFISFASAQITEFTYKQNTLVDLKIVCINNGFCSSSTICNVSVFDPDSVVILDGITATQAASLAYFNVTLNTTQTSKLGEYQLTGFCKDGSVSVEIDFPFWISADGNKLSTPDALVRIFLIIFFIFLLVGTYLTVKKIDFKRWNDDILEKYKTKNMVKMVFSALLYNIMKNVYIIYYLMGLPILMVLQNITYSYNITSMIVFMDVLLLIYTIGIILVGLIFLSYVQEWSIETLELVKDMDWGLK